MAPIVANWKRLIGWALLIFVAFQLVGIAMSVATAPRIFGVVATQLSAFVLYFVFFRRTARHKALLGASLFGLIQLIDIAVVFALSQSTTGLLDLPGTIVSFAVCLAALLASLLSSNNSFKGMPLRGTP